MKPTEILEMLDENIYRNLSVNYNSDGILMTKKELKPKVRMIKTLILNFTIQALIEKEMSYIEFQEAKDLMI